MENSQRYISERIVNLKECETAIATAVDLSEYLRKEVEKENPSMTKINEFSKGLHKALIGVKYFEFEIEKRKVICECQ